MKNRFRGLSESRRLEMLQMTVEQIYDAGYEDAERLNPVAQLSRAFSKMIEKKTPNQRRAELIQRAREFVESKKVTRESKAVYIGPDFPNHWCNADFHVNAEKRTVVCLLRYVEDNRVIRIGKAKCAPGEVFNADIGKAIALARALDIEVPAEFLDAVQPDEFAVGQHFRHNDDFYEVHKTDEEKAYASARDNGPFARLEDLGTHYRITDDTNAQYQDEP